MRRSLALFGLLAVVLPYFAAGNKDAVFAEIGQTLDELARLSSLRVRRPVEYDLISREKVNEYLKQRVKDEIKPEELRAEELTLKKFGFVPRDFNLLDATVDLLTEQAAAFYDFRKKKLFIADWASSSMQQAALVHELAHALADQNFNLEKFIKAAGKSDDGSMARVAVMEGQASWLMSEFMARKMGQSLANSPALLEMMSRGAELADSQYPEFAKAPLYVRETLIFPYTKGMLFQQAVFQKSGQAGFSEIFRRPPVSTQQILHPEKYFSNLAPASPEVPEPPGSGLKKLAEGSIGELDHSILLRQFVGKDEADEIAPRWRGGNYRLFENRARDTTVLAYASEWESPEAARRFFALYRRILEKKLNRMVVTGESAGHLAGTSDDGAFSLRLEGPVFSSLEGMR